MHWIWFLKPDSALALVPNYGRICWAIIKLPLAAVDVGIKLNVSAQREL